jgi:hypothetical protein
MSKSGSNFDSTLPYFYILINTFGYPERLLISEYWLYSSVRVTSNVDGAVFNLAGSDFKTDAGAQLVIDNIPVGEHQIVVKKGRMQTTTDLVGGFVKDDNSRQGHSLSSLHNASCSFLI